MRSFIRAALTQYATVWLWPLFTMSRVCIFVYLAGRYSDLGVHVDSIREINAGHMPFRDFFPEYPPLVFLFTYVPAVFDASLKWYAPIFRAMCFAVDCGIWVAVLRCGQRSAVRIGQQGTNALGGQRETIPFCSTGSPVQAADGTRSVPATLTNSAKSEGRLPGAPPVGQCLLYILGTTALGPLIYDRIDIVLGGLLLIAVISVLKGRDGLANLSIGTGIAFKLIPVVLVPALLAIQFRKNARRVWRAALALALPTFVSFDAMAVLGGWRLDKLFEYHLKRGIQIESVPASVEMVFMMFGASGSVDYTFKSHNLSTVYAGGLTAVATGLLALMVVGSAIVPFRRRMNPRSTALLISAVLSAALVLSKVLSPQFFLFLLPVLVVIPVPRRRWEAVANWSLIAAIYVLTGLIFPWFYDDLIKLQPAAEWLVIARNEFLAILAISLFYRAWTASAPLDDAWNSGEFRYETS
jgi:hypothetical protein